MAFQGRLTCSAPQCIDNGHICASWKLNIRPTRPLYGLFMDGLRITDYGLRITDYGLRITDSGLQYRLGYCRILLNHLRCNISTTALWLKHLHA